MSAINPLELSGSPGIITLESSLQKKKEKKKIPCLLHFILQYKFWAYEKIFLSQLAITSK